MLYTSTTRFCVHCCVAVLYSTALDIFIVCVLLFRGSFLSTLEHFMFTSSGFNRNFKSYFFFQFQLQF